MEVSIPETSISDDGKFTIYHIRVKVSGKSSTLKKRYSDFAALKQELETMYSTSIPYKFPRRTLIRNTVTNPSFAEERRSELESFLQQIADDELDMKWKKSLPFKEFLNLPPGVFSNANDTTKEKLNDAWSLVANNNEPITDLPSWLEIARATKKKIQEAKSTVYKSPSDTRKFLVLARARFEGLRKGLTVMEDEGAIGEGELKRRSELLSSLEREHRDIESLLSNISQFPDRNNQAQQQPLGQSMRSQLFKGRRVIGQPQETERTRGNDNQQLLQIQKNDMKEQDQELEQLSQAIQRQKQLGVAINEELQLQNELLEELDTEVDRTTSKLHYAQKRVGKFT